jgi:DtxR family Mn-dependent transcriptional regulator
MTEETQYLLAIYIAEEQRSPPVSFDTLGARLDRSPATVTEMCQRLDERGLVVYLPYEGVALTDEGTARASELHETYVTLSWFFRDVLDLEDHESEAMEMAGMVSPQVADRLAATLLAGDAREDPRPDGDGQS